MFQTPRMRVLTGGAHEVLRAEQIEGPESYLARERRALFLRGTITGVQDRWDPFSPVAVHDSILAMNYDDSKKPIYLFIESSGGLVGTGFVLYDVIRMSPAPIVTVGVNVASMAAVLLAAGTRRLVYPHASVMLHLPQGGFSGDVKDLEIRTKEMGRIRDRIADAYIECGVDRTREQILKDIDREVWLNAEEAVAYGLADGIVGRAELFGP